MMKLNLNREALYPIPADLKASLAMVIAYLSYDGEILAANEGFYRLLQTTAGERPTFVGDDFFIQPCFTDLVASDRATTLLHKGLFTLRAPCYPATFSLRGQLTRHEKALRLFAEHPIEEMEQLQRSVLDLNQELVESQRQLARLNWTLQRRISNDSAKLQENSVVLNLMAEVFAQMGESIAILDAGLHITQVNPAFCKLTGYAAKEVLGQNPKMLAPSESLRIRHLCNKLESEGSWQGELTGRHQNGTDFPVWLSVNVLRDCDGNPTEYICSFSDITERKASEAKLQHQAFHDALTQLPNRLNLDEQLSSLLRSSRSEDKALAVMVIDLDEFKSVNDALGHQIGDQLLQQVASRIRHAVRDTDIVARLGGDEFVVVLTGIRSPAEADLVAQKIVSEVSLPYKVAEHELRTSPSIGISLFPKDGSKSGDLIRFADVAMYDAKARGRGVHRFYRRSMSLAANARRAMEIDLRQALENDQFMLHYQPLLDLTSGRLVGMEALVRWCHPSRGIIYPDEFIALAEDFGLITRLGDWVLTESCRQLSSWLAEGLAPLRMSVNLSPSQFRDQGLPNRVHAILERFGLQRKMLDFEVTESMAMESPEATIGMLRQLREDGITLSIDDFGTGYSSLSYLKLFPLHTLKIDCSFVPDLETNRNDADICDMIVMLAHKLGLKVLAEDVETLAQIRFLAKAGCERIQGNLLSKPLPGELARDFIQRFRPALPIA